MKTLKSLAIDYSEDIWTLDTFSVQYRQEHGASPTPATTAPATPQGPVNDDENRDVDADGEDDNVPTLEEDHPQGEVAGTTMLVDEAPQGEQAGSGAQQAPVDANLWVQTYGSGSQQAPVNANTGPQPNGSVHRRGSSQGAMSLSNIMTDYDAGESSRSAESARQASARWAEQLRLEREEAQRKELEERRRIEKEAAKQRRLERYGKTPRF
jgi:hypothetical protein